jgi:hypothetical protein
MTVQVNNAKLVGDDLIKQWVHITLTVDGDSCKYTTVVPWNHVIPAKLTGSALGAYCDGRESQYQLSILKSMYPNARYQDATGDTELAKFTAWIAAGHKNTAYCKSGSPYCSIATVPASCTDAEGDDQATCELNGGTWVPEVLSPSDQTACEEAEGTWVTVFDTAEKAILANGQWIPEEVITKVSFDDSHAYTGDMRTRKLEELNQDLQTYLYTKYDVGTQISFQAIDSRADTPQAVKDSMAALFAWISGVMNHYYAKKIAVRDNADWEAVTWDFATSFDATDPDVSLEALMGPQ